jgi:hypothetical protein
MILRRFLITAGSVGLVTTATPTQGILQAASAVENRAEVRQSQTATTPHDTANVEEMTLAGCLMRHRDVPAPTNASSVASAAKHDGYLLVDAMAVPHHRSSNGMLAKGAAAGGPHDHAAAADVRPVVNPTPNPGDSQMFKVEGLSDAELQQFAGTRVMLMGAVVAGDPASRTPAAAIKDGHDAAPFKATMIHPAPGPCRQ